MRQVRQRRVMPWLIVLALVLGSLPLAVMADNDAPIPQQIVGGDSRTRVSPVDRAVVMLEVSDAAGDVALQCTGTLIGANVVLTAAHCLYSVELGGWSTEIVVKAGLDGGAAQVVTQAAQKSVPEPWLAWQPSNFDFGIVVTKDSLGAFGAKTLVVASDNSLMSASLNIAATGYPTDKPNGTQWRSSTNQLLTFTADMLAYDLDTAMGESGSAVRRGSDDGIIAVHTGAVRTFNVGIRVTEPLLATLSSWCGRLACSFNSRVDADLMPSVSDSDQAAFTRTRNRTDMPIVMGAVSRTWMWGPEPTTRFMWEDYAEGPGGKRIVRYEEKSRMELTHDASVPNDSPWYITNGLLSKELISGQMQVGDAKFEPRLPAQIPVAGDSDDATGPTYATFAQVLDAPALDDGAAVVQRIDRAGNVVVDPSLQSRGVTAAHRVTVPGIDHQVASPFWTFMNARGPVFENNAIVEAQLFENPFYATGYPITEAYWAQVKVGGEYRDVLMQCFERRCLTYTPGNSPGWEVEAGNVGLHYFSWRYGYTP